MSKSLFDRTPLNLVQRTVKVANATNENITFVDKDGKSIIYEPNPAHMISIETAYYTNPKCIDTTDEDDKIFKSSKPRNETGITILEEDLIFNNSRVTFPEEFDTDTVYITTRETFLEMYIALSSSSVAHLPNGKRPLKLGYPKDPTYDESGKIIGYKTIVMSEMF